MISWDTSRPEQTAVDAPYCVNGGGGWPCHQNPLTTSKILIAGPSEADLQKYGITLNFLEFVRSLTYSTFRDFPLEQIPTDNQEDSEKKVLTPWQERHALLIVQQVQSWTFCQPYITGRYYNTAFSTCKVSSPLLVFLNRMSHLNFEGHARGLTSASDVKYLGKPELGIKKAKYWK